MHWSNVEEYFNDMEMKLMNIKNMLEKYNDLLQKANDISDKLTLEKEINNAEMEIKMIERNNKETITEQRLPNRFSI
jgi:hypothetical protein